jgi:uncharacterized membrane protein YqaE (UPF0057 family)
MPITGNEFCKGLIAFLLPPVGVFLERGCGADLLINILLTMLGFIPGEVRGVLSSYIGLPPSTHQYYILDPQFSLFFKLSVFVFGIGTVYSSLSIAPNRIYVCI